MPSCMMSRVSMTWARAARSVAALGIVAGSLSACGGEHEQGPNADPRGLFPQHYSEKGFMDPGSALVSATAADASTQTYSFDVDMGHAFSLVANCTRGSITVSGAVSHCKGGPAGVVGLCAGQHEQLTAHVSTRQPHTWGVAVYRTAPC